MQCSFTLTQDDYNGLMKAVGQRLSKKAGANSKMSFINLITWCVIGIAISSYISLFQRHPEASCDLIFVGAFSVASFLMVFLTITFKNRLYCKVMLSEKSWFFAEQTLTFSSTGLSAKGAYGSAQYEWSAFQHLAEDARNLYLFIDNAQAYVLPKFALEQTGATAQIREWLSNEKSA